MAIRLGHRDINIDRVYAPMAVVSFQSGKYGDAIEFSHSAIRHNPDNGSVHRFLAASLARDGQMEQARAAWVKAGEIQPLDIPTYVASLRRRYKRDEDAQDMIEGMRLAGAPFE